MRQFLIAGAVAVGFFSPAFAVTPISPAATGNILVSYPADYDSSVTYTAQPNPPVKVEIITPGTASIPNAGYASVSPAPDPTLTASAETSAFNTGVQSEAFLEYYFEIVGPTAVLPIDISYSGTTTNAAGAALGSVESFASIEFGNVGTETGGRATGDPTLWLEDSGGTFTYAGAVQNMIAANSPTLVRLNAFTQGNDGDSGFVQLDPIISIDPLFAQIDSNYLSDYSIVTSPGVGNSPGGIPEPATWAMMLVGVGMIGATMRMAPTRVAWR